ncbi:glucosaminidase domain-containing protein [Mangrovimonas aestuarii]|uniref:glucosaminidase domain-containing protein n=1 Tax=Mangrovimonas aestuarii TaxID=3018443 RepID=UPI00237923F7|nr:glucosaminidase domain-containing protein [Mangrovimonas aestuarii]
MKRILLIAVLGIALTSCGSKRQVTTKRYEPRKSNTTTTTQSSTASTNTETTSNYSDPVQAYIATYSVIAQDEMRLYGIPASITLAQGILESGSGKGRLAVQANNHFGIKCHDWTGDRIYHDDDAKQECFRKYNDAKYSFRDHSLFLKNRNRYYKLFDLREDDYKGWARELRAAGYATDRKYPDKLIDLIQRYNLDQYDAEVLGKRYKGIAEEAAVSNNIAISERHVVSKGDTLYSISKKYNLTVDKLKQINGLKDNSISIGQELIVSQ